VDPHVIEIAARKLQSALIEEFRVGQSRPTPVPGLAILPLNPNVSAQMLPQKHSEAGPHGRARRDSP
jgi:hypothetical protein